MKKETIWTCDYCCTKTNDENQAFSCEQKCKENETKLRPFTRGLFIKYKDSLYLVVKEVQWKLINKVRTPIIFCTKISDHFNHAMYCFTYQDVDGIEILDDAATLQLLRETVYQYQFRFLASKAVRGEVHAN